MREDILTTKFAKDTKDSEIITFQFSYFVLFASFVVNSLFRFWLRLCRARSFVVVKDFRWVDDFAAQCSYRVFAVANTSKYTPARRRAWD